MTTNGQETESQKDRQLDRQIKRERHTFKGFARTLFGWHNNQSSAMNRYGAARGWGLSHDEAMEYGKPYASKEERVVNIHAGGVIPAILMAGLLGAFMWWVSQQLKAPETPPTPDTNTEYEVKPMPGGSRSDASLQTREALYGRIGEEEAQANQVA